MNKQKFLDSVRFSKDLGADLHDDGFKGLPGFLFLEGYWVELTKEGQFYCLAVQSEIMADTLREAADWLWENFVKYEYPESFLNETVADIAESAEFAFWGAVANLCPLAKSGDLGPDVVVPLCREMENAIKQWLLNNDPRFNQ